MARDIDGNQVAIGDRVRVLKIDKGVFNKLADNEKAHHLAMVDEVFSIDDIVEDGLKARVSIQWTTPQGICTGGLDMLAHEFRLEGAPVTANPAAQACDYLWLFPGQPLPEETHRPPYKAIVIVDSDVTPEWQWELSQWLVTTGCRYMMAWGRDCSSWDDSVDWAQLEAFDFGDIPASDFLPTTWHEDEALDEVFWFAKHCAAHPVHLLGHVLLLHIAPHPDQDRLGTHYARA